MPSWCAPSTGRMIYFEADDGRICLVYDYLGRALVGSTDIPADDPDDGALRRRRDRLLPRQPAHAAPRPRASTATQIVYAYSGIRPLPASDAATPGLISRDHSAPVAEPAGDRPFPIVSLVGGKWTTFRGFAEEVADTIARPPRPHPRRLDPRARHRRRPGLPRRPRPGRAGSPTPPARPACPSARLDALLSRYGTTALAIARTAARGRRRPPARRQPTTASPRSTGSRATSASSISPTS